MNPRERFIETLCFGHPDRIPFTPGHGRESTQARWRREGLPEGVDPTAYLHEILGIEPESVRPVGPLGVDYRMIPRFEEKVLSHADGHYIVQDWKGNVCEISDEFDVTYLRTARDFVTRRWLSCPVENAEDWAAMAERYDVNQPGRFPDDFERRCAEAADRDAPLGIHVDGPFWQMREWCGFEGLCMMMVEQPDLVAAMAEFWCEFIDGLLERVLRSTTLDYIHISEDMAYKAKAMISPAMVRAYCKPCWDRWAERARGAGVPIVAIDSDGYIGELIPIWIESGVNACDPVEVAAHCDIVEFRQRYGRAMAYRGGVDKRCIARGGKVLRDELKRLEPVIRDGGYIPGCDHGVPSDVSWPNFVDYTRRLAELTGWL